MKDISWILPTNRPFSEFGLHIVNDVFHIMAGEDYSYEIVVYSPNEPIQHEHVKWVQEPPEKHSSALGFNEAYKESEGKYIYTVTDYIHIDKGSLKCVELLESEVFRDRKFKVTSMVMEPVHYDTTHMPVIGSRCSHPAFPTKIGVNQPVGPVVWHDLPPELCDPKYLLPENKYSIMTHPVFDRNTVNERLSGHLFNPKFKHHYADNWIGFYIGEFGGEFPILCEEAFVESVRAHKGYYGDDERDFATFCDLAVKLIKGEYMEYV